MMRRVLIAVGASALTTAALTAVTAAQAAPTVQVMVVGKTRTLVNPRQVKLRATRVKIAHKHCSVPRGTALAGLVWSGLSLHVTDVGGCDPASMFVTRVSGQANHGQAGWEYKVGHRAPSFGAADPGGRLRSGEQLLWFWCLHASACQRTLGVTAHFKGNLTQVHVVGYDDNGHGRSIAKATVHLGSQTATTNAHGWASAALPPGNYKVYATKPGLVRSFPIRVTVA
jgi:hypothetical protein